MASRKSTAVATIEHRAEEHVGSVIRKVTQAMAAHSRSMLLGSQSTPFDVLKANSNMPVVGHLGPQSTGYYLPPLVRFSRHLDRNDGYVSKGLDIRADATVDTGPWPVFATQALNDLWEEWQLECDRRGKMTHGQITKKSFRNQLSGGEGWVTLHDEPMSSDLVVPLTIKGIELDQVDSFDNRLNPDNGNRIISGVELDADDRVVAMWVLPYNPTDMNTMSRWSPSVRTPIADICHLFEETEFSSVRGIPTIAPAIMKAIQEMKFENATAARMIASSLFTHWAEQTDKSAGGAKMPGEKDIDDWIEDKALGIKMRQPMFQIRDLCRDNQVAVFSSNYALYGDMSRRMNSVYERFSPDVEIYSIDESFIDVSRLPVKDRTAWASDLRSTTRQWTGIPTCVGIGPTKTLAKLANKAAKKLPAGVLDLSDPSEQASVMANFPIGDVWGIGRASQLKLMGLGIQYAGQLRDMDPKLARQLMTVVGERIIHELNGRPCIALETVAPQRKGCAVTRSFGNRVTTKVEMEQAVAGYATRLGEKLRRHGLATDHVTVFMHTSAFADDEPQRNVSMTVDIPEATNDSLTLIKAARRAVDRLWQSGFRYSKAGIITQDLVPPPIPQRALFDNLDHERAAKVMAAMDEANRRWGRATVVPAAVGIASKSAFTTKFEMRSPRYTTRWDELPECR